jgi:oxygen-independent coproporphyrinogen-3 oxidase
VNATRREIRRRVRSCEHRIDTVFIGGGTPTILPTDQLRALFETLGRALAGRALREFTVEANPETVDRATAALLAQAGVDRVSMGAQSFSPAELAVLERSHEPEDVPQAVQMLRRWGIERINLDLIFGVPGQTLDTWAASLRRAIDLGVDHLSCYGLTYEAGTRLTARRDSGLIRPCEEALEAEMFLLTIETLAAAGYEQYEISNYAKPGCACVHNLIYWHNAPYVGVGPAAVGCTRGRRYRNVADVDAYVRLIEEQGLAEAESETITREMLAIEMILLQLRLVEGMSIPAFAACTGANPVALFGATLDRLVESGQATVSKDQIALTRSGMLVSDAIMAELACACDSL